ncbi:MAG: hypothetical protein RR959_08965, partial [Erysipelotrichaceae bacterium]
MKLKIMSFCKKYYPMLIFVIISLIVNIAYFYRTISFNLFLALESFAWFVTFILLSWQQYKEKHMTIARVLFVIAMIDFVSTFLWYMS